MALKPDDDGHYRFVTLQGGSVLNVIGEVQRSGLVEIMYEGRGLAAFMRDIEERAEKVETAT